MMASISFAAPGQVPSLSPSPDSFQPTYLESVPLRYVDPAAVIKTLKANTLPAGVTRIFPDKANKKIVQVLGTQEGIASIRPLITLLDVAPRSVSLGVRIIQVRVPPKGKTVTTIIKTGNYTTPNNVPVVVTARAKDSGDAFQVSLDPRIADTTEKQITLLMQFGIRFANKSSLGVGRGLTVKRGAALQRVIGLTKSTDKAVLKSVVQGEIPQGWRGGSLQVYFVEVQADLSAKAH